MKRCGVVVIGFMRKTTLVILALTALLLTACAQVRLPDLSAYLPRADLPATRWDHRPEAAEWTTRALVAVAARDDVLALQVPGDIEKWCPGYEKASVAKRRAFWVGLLSAVAKYESSWNPKAAGGGGRYVGLMQISPKSASNYGCAATSSKALKNGGANLECAVKMLSYQVGRDGVVAGKGNRGIGRDWMPLRKSSQRAAMAGWTSKQAYCAG